MKSRIILIRHGLTPGNLQRLYYGSTDLPLSEEGIENIKKHVNEGIYPGSAYAEYYTTGMLRTEQSLRYMYGDVPHEAIEKLKELDFGDFEMKSYEELTSRPEYRDWCNTYEDGTPPPNGESIRHFNQRIKEGFNELLVKHELLMLRLRNEGEEAVSICVCHGGVICAILNSIWPDETDVFYEWIPAPGHGYILHIEDGAIVDKEKF